MIISEYYDIIILIYYISILYYYIGERLWGSSFLGSLRGEAPHKLQSSLGEVVTVNMSQMPTENMFQKGPKS